MTMTNPMTPEAGFAALDVALTLPADALAEYLSRDPLPMLVRAGCPVCDAAVRTFDHDTRMFGCLSCTYASDERNG